MCLCENLSIEGGIEVKEGCMCKQCVVVLLFV